MQRGFGKSLLSFKTIITELGGNEMLPRFNQYRMPLTVKVQRQNAKVLHTEQQHGQVLHHTDITTSGIMARIYVLWLFEFVRICFPPGTLFPLGTLTSQRPHPIWLPVPTQKVQT